MRYAFTLSGKTHHVVLEEHADGPKFVIEDTTFEPVVKAVGPGQYEVTVDGESFPFTLRHGRVELGPHPLDLEVQRARPALVRKGGAGKRGDGRIKPPMPGKIVEIGVKVGDVVEEGDVLLVLEAMKMQNDIKSPLGGVVSQVLVKEGGNVEATTVMLEIEPHPEGE